MKNTALLFTVFTAFTSVQAIFKGKIAKAHQFPYVVYIEASKHFCAGAIITDRHILTAAHCLLNTEQVTVYVGAQSYENRKMDGVAHVSETFWMHEDFEMPSAVNDIGLIQLPKALKFNKKVKSIPISQIEDIESEQGIRSVSMAGWGFTENGDDVANELRYAELTLISMAKCQNYEHHYIEDLSEDNVCTKRISGMPCSGDSGGALVSKKSKQIIGVLSYVKDAKDGEKTKNDCKSKVPAVFTRVASYLDWISEKIGIQFEEDEDSDESEKDESNSDEESDESNGEEEEGNEESEESDEENDDAENDDGSDRNNSS